MAHFPEIRLNYAESISHDKLLTLLISLDLMNFQYFVSVVPTDVQTTAGFTYNTYQYSVKEQVRCILLVTAIWPMQCFFYLRRSKAKQLSPLYPSPIQVAFSPHKIVRKRNATSHRLLI